VHSLPQLEVVCSYYYRWREEAVMEKMSDIVVYLVKQLNSIQQQ